MLTAQGVSYKHPNGDLLFANISFHINKQDKVALLGNNGAGKSTLLKILAGKLDPIAGQVVTSAKTYYVPQLFGQFDHYSIAQVLQIDGKLKALNNILQGDTNSVNFEVLDDDWTLEERCHQAFKHWQLDELDFTHPFEKLSGGQKTKVFLAGIMIHQPEIVLLDEPSNHLDLQSRALLYDYILSTKNTMVVVSHDRTLLNLLDMVYELHHQSIALYGGNYDFYAAQKMIEKEAFVQDLKSKEKSLRKAKKTARASLERQQKLDARGKKKQEKAGLPTISMNTLRNKAEKSTSRIKDVHTDKVGGMAKELSELRSGVPDLDKMKIAFDPATLHKGKVLVKANNINFGYGNRLLWKQPLNFQILSGERTALSGANGSGKTTLIKMLLGEIKPQLGIMDRAEATTIYVDQNYSLINPELSVYQQAQFYNSGVLQEHDIKIRLNRFLFTNEYWDKPCAVLSGGEKMRLMLCALTISNQAPDMMILDEPTNNLDIQNIEILTHAINGYEGTLLVVSHDEFFLKQINIEKVILLG